MPRTGRRRPAAPTNIAPASSARTSGPRTSSATRASPRDSSASSAPWKPVPPSHSCPDRNGPSSSADSRQQRVLYYYFLDREFGLIHVRLQTWLPFTVQVYVNGHEWLAQQMVHKKLGFVQQHNAFTQLDDPDKAQRIADRFAKLDWPKILDRWAKQVNPLLRELFPGYPVHWVVDQAEYATDLLFQSRAALAGLYRALLDYAVRTFTPKDILGFLGRKWDRRFDGEVHTHYEDDRWFGTRIKHRMKSNWLKMYDKFGLILRVETVINSPKEFWVYRTQWHRDGTSSVGYYPMTKSVASLVDYQEQALACNRRYLDALAVVDDPTPAYQDLRQLTEPKVVDGRSYAGFNPARRDDVRLFRAVLDGDHIARGFRNADIREPLFGRLLKAEPATACQCGGGAAAQTPARTPSGGKDPAHTTLASHRTRQTLAGEGSSSSTIPPGRNSRHSQPLLPRKLLRILRRSSGERI